MEVTKDDLLGIDIRLPEARKGKGENELEQG